MARPNPPSRLLLIRERDVGLFSMVLQVINTLSALKDGAGERTPVVLLGRGLAYFDPDGFHGKRSVWEYYFSPVVPGMGESEILPLLGDDAFEQLESKRLALEHARGARDWPDRLHQLPPLTPRDRDNLARLDAACSGLDWVWTDDFQPDLNGHEKAGKGLPVSVQRDLAARFIRPNPRVEGLVEGFYATHLEGHVVIGVHVRGTDGFKAPARGTPIDFDRYFAEVDARLADFGRDRCRVFLATDEQACVARFRERFGDALVCREIDRSAPEDPPFGRGPTGQMMPGYLTAPGRSATQNGEDAVVDYALLARSDFLVHNHSSLSLVARLSVGDSLML